MPLRHMNHGFQEDLNRNPQIALGAPDSYLPAVNKS
jgi:hypothetical protein